MRGLGWTILIAVNAILLGSMFWDTRIAVGMNVKNVLIKLSAVHKIPPDDAEQIQLVRDRIDAMPLPTLSGTIEQQLDIEVPFLDPSLPGGIPIRLYVPAQISPQAKRGLYIYYHGGGWVLFHIPRFDWMCRELANRTGAVVASVDYRLAPLHKFPAAADDAVSAALQLIGRARNGTLGVKGVDANKVIVGGDSAGGNLAAVVAQHLASIRVPLKLQVLGWPVLDAGFNHVSWAENVDAPILPLEMMSWFRLAYLPEPRYLHVSNPRYAPLLAKDDNLRGVAPALIFTSTYDGLRGEAESYAARLQENGVKATIRNFDNVHAFVGFDPTTQDSMAAMQLLFATVVEAFK